MIAARLMVVLVFLQYIWQGYVDALRQAQAVQPIYQKAGIRRMDNSALTTLDMDRIPVDRPFIIIADTCILHVVRRASRRVDDVNLVGRYCINPTPADHHVCRQLFAKMSFSERAHPSSPAHKGGVVKMRCNGVLPPRSACDACLCMFTPSHATGPLA